jgi:4-hydroxyphenylacetate 3-monooxygenase
MIRTGDEYRAVLRDRREIWIDGERVEDVTAHPAFRPVVDLKAHWHEKWRAVDAYLNDIRGILTRAGDETVGSNSSRRPRAYPIASTAPPVEVQRRVRH